MGNSLYIAPSNSYHGEGLFSYTDLKRGEVINASKTQILKMNDADFDNHLVTSRCILIESIFRAYHDNMQSNCMIYFTGKHLLILRDVPAGEELTRKYGTEYWMSSIKKFIMLNQNNQLSEGTLEHVNKAASKWFVPISSIK
jgi:hypothetical protein